VAAIVRAYSYILAISLTFHRYSVAAPSSYNLFPVQALSVPAHTTTYAFVPTSTFVTRVIAPSSPFPLATITLRFDCFAPDLVNTLLTKADTDVPLGEFECVPSSQRRGYV
jgi:hypothetical protein